MSKEALNKIETHEKECTIRYQNIEKRLDEGAKRFTRIEPVSYTHLTMPTNREV